MLTSAENLAIHLAFVFALPAEESAKIASANAKTVEDAVDRLSPSIRGRMIPFDDYLSEKPKADRDSFRLNKEVLLAQLQHQHDECLRAWTISVDHANRLAEFSKRQQISDTEPPKKPYVGDIRFLQLAKHLRREMDRIEIAIAEHVDEILKAKEESQSASVGRSEKNQDTKDTFASALPNPILSSQTAAPTPPAQELPALTAARVATVQPIGPEFDELTFPALHELKRRRDIPTIAPPPRKKDKYAGVNR